MSGNANSGRRPKPSALKLLQGNPGRRPLNDAEPQPAPIAPDAPQDLSPRERELWDEVIEELRYMGTLARSDKAVIYAYIDSWAKLEAARAVLAEAGSYYDQIFVDGAGVEHKKIVAHPAVKVAKDEKAALRAYGTLLGLDPSSRSRLKVQGRGADDGEGILNVG